MSLCRLVERNQVGRLANLCSSNSPLLSGQRGSTTPTSTSLWSTVVGSVDRSFGSSRTSQDSSASNGTASSSKVITDVTSVAQWDEIMKESKLGNKGVIAQFTAQWCPPCRMIAPFVQQLAKDHAGTVTFVKVDIDSPQVSAIVADHTVSAVPTFVGYSKSGSIVHTFSGADKNALEQTVAMVST